MLMEILVACVFNLGYFQILEGSSCIAEHLHAILMGFLSVVHIYHSGDAFSVPVTLLYYDA